MRTFEFGIVDTPKFLRQSQLHDCSCDSSDFWVVACQHDEPCGIITHLTWARRCFICLTCFAFARAFQRNQLKAWSIGHGRRDGLAPQRVWFKRQTFCSFPICQRSHTLTEAQAGFTPTGTMLEARAFCHLKASQNHWLQERGSVFLVLKAAFRGMLQKAFCLLLQCLLESLGDGPDVSRGQWSPPEQCNK